MNTSTLCVPLAAVLFASPAFCGVHMVDASGSGEFATLQAAVDASLSGDVLLVRSGTYAGFTVDGKALSIFEDAGATVLVNGTVQLVNLGAGRTFVMQGIEIDGPVSASGSGPALVFANDAGHVRLQDCTLRGGNGYLGSMNPWNPGANGVELNTSSDVIFVRCAITGGKGEGSLPGQGYYDFGGQGGDALRARACAAALYDCALTGGDGGGGESAGGNGGRGYDHDQGGGGALLSGCTILGGNGGLCHGYGLGGTGGDALFAAPAAHHHLLASTAIAGAGGASTGYPRAPYGIAFAGPGSFDFFNDLARSLVITPLSPLGGIVTVTYTGVAGDQLFVAGAAGTTFWYLPAWEGVLALPFPLRLPVTPHAVLGATGSVTFPMALGDLGVNQNTGLVFLQGLVIDALGHNVLSTPTSVLRLRCSALTPDCDGNGRFDSCDILISPVSDANHNGILEVCEQDCNHNGIPDGTDIAQGTSADVNLDGTPDSCETPQVIHVDAAAAPFGDGSAQAPFRTIGEGVAASISGDSVLVADGTYSGALNRDVDLGGRSIAIESVHGASATVIDCAALGRAFALHQGESSATLVRGFTIRNGRVGGNSWVGNMGGGAIAISHASLQVEDCVFEACTAPQGGGALATQAANLLVRGSTFRDNGAPTGYPLFYSAGGAICANGGALNVQGCLFETNRGSVGGALSTSASGGVTLVEGCTFRGNFATFFGGALMLEGPGTLDSCLITGNSAPAGGGVGAHVGATLVHCTVTGNSATQKAGGLFAAYSMEGGGQTIFVHDTILWGNSAPTGAQIGSELFSDIVRMRSCDLQGGAAGVSLGAGTLDYDGSNLAVDPLFADADGPDNNPATWADNDWHLAATSPCIDAGNNGLVPSDFFDLDADLDTSETVPFDLDGLPRFIDIPGMPNTGIGTSPITDIGAYERQP